MTPEQLIQNTTALAQGLMPVLATLAAVIGTLVYALGKAGDSPNLVRWGKNAWLGAAILFGGTAVVGLVQFVAGKIFGTA